MQHSAQPTLAARVDAEQGPLNGTASVCPSVCLSHSPAAAACGGFAAVQGCSPKKEVGDA